jgi:anion-transporting  ArsA/GET3 family ATPase
MPASMTGLDSRPLQFVVGKGGVGKSTVTAAIAVAHAAAGKRVLAVELGRPEGLSRFLAPGLETGPEPIPIRERLSLARVQGDDALAEYLRLILPGRGLLNLVFGSRLYRYFVAAAPGLKELMAIGKIWYEREKRDADGHAMWDVIVVDAGASGHSLQYLQMPSTAARTFRSGLVHRESERIAALLADAATTAVHVVVIPEDMPLTEGREILARLAGDLGLPVGAVYVNRVRPRPPDRAAAAAEALARTSPDDPDAGIARAVAATALRSLGWVALQEEKLARFAREVDVATMRLPVLPAERFGLTEIEALAALISEAGGSPR